MKKSLINGLVFVIGYVLITFGVLLATVAFSIVGYTPANPWEPTNMAYYAMSVPILIIGMIIAFGGAAMLKTLQKMPGRLISIMPQK